MPTTAAALLTKTRLAFVVLFIALVLVLPLTDPDYFWHLKAGEYIVTHRALPPGDVFSFTRFGQPWVLHEWLFEVVLYGVFATGGALGVKLLTALCIMAALGVTYVLARRLGQSRPLAFVLVLFGGCAFAMGCAPRPQLVTYLLFALFLSILLREKYDGARRAVCVLPLLMVVWVNAHGGYLIGIALLFLFTGAEWLDYWWDAARPPAGKGRLVRLSLIALATLLATLVNPEFVKHWLYPFQVLGMEANQWINEWQSPDFHSIGPRIYLSLCVLFVLSYIYARPRAGLTELVLPGFFLVNGFVSVRHIPLAVLTVLPFIALALGRGGLAACAASWRGSRLERRYAGSVGTGKQLGPAAEGVLNWIVLLAIVIALVLYRPSFDAAKQHQGAKLPAAAADYVIAHRIKGNIFNAYGQGGYLIYRFWPERKVCIDGRADVYGDKFFKEHKDIYSGAADWKEKFDRLAIDYAILDNDAPIRQLLLADGSFRQAYRDKRHSVLLRSIPRQAVLPGKPVN